MQIWAFETMLKIGDRFGRRLGQQSPRLLNWTSTKQPQHRTYDTFFKNVKMHVYATLRSTEAERGQPYISNLVPFEDCSVPALDNVWRRLRGDKELGDGKETGSDESTDGNGEDSDDGDSGDNDGATVRASLTRARVEEMLLDQRTLIEIRLRTVKLEIIQHVTNEFVRLREFISTLVPPSGSTTTAPTTKAENEPRVVSSLPHDLDENGDETDPDSECAEPQVHARDFDPLSDDHEEDMGIEMQEGNGGCNMDLEPRMNGDDDAVAFGGPRNRDDEPIVSASGVVEVDGK
ncbi:Hypothetical predicted protein [Olea europaea subsp. europaea]|uniref:Uncharacterized protein n=1 Tax=Olea europaea subsp. europaea TaxID=158383 RepID=A0A8S0PDX3_OLEEU|nr:Hypothetical predicted protein [Olea europaea subsp. europaea]